MPRLPSRSRRLRARVGAALAGAALAGAALALGACDAATGPLPRAGAPADLEFSMGGFGTGSTFVESRADTVILRRVSWFGDPTQEQEVARAVPTAEAWRAFWAAAERAGVGEWKREYVAEGVVDGHGWSLRVVSGGHAIESSGSNAYPDRLGREHELEMTDDFRLFVDALGALVDTPLR